MIYVLIVVLVLILGILFYHFVLKSDNNQEKEYKVSDKDKDTLEIKNKYMFQIEIKVLEILNSIDPKKYLALPKICMGSMLLPKGSKNVYNLLSNKVLDYVIFDRQTMKPILIVDIFDNTFNDEALAEQDPNLTKILADLKLPVVSIMVKNTVDEQKFKQEVTKNLPKEEKKEEK